MKTLVICPDRHHGILLQQYFKLGCYGQNLDFVHASTMKEVVASVLDDPLDLIVMEPDFITPGGRGLIKVLREYLTQTPIAVVHLNTINQCDKDCLMVCLEYGAQWHFNRVADLEQVMEWMKSACETH